MPDSGVPALQLLRHYSGIQMTVSGEIKEGVYPVIVVTSNAQMIFIT